MVLILGITVNYSNSIINIIGNQRGTVHHLGLLELPILNRHYGKQPKYPKRKK